MAINLKPDPAKGWETCALFKVDPTLISQAKDRDIVVVSTTLGVYTVKSKTKVFANVPIKTTAITLAKSKSLGPSSVEQYKYALEAGLKKAIAETPSPASVPYVAPKVIVADADQPPAPGPEPTSLGALLKAKLAKDPDPQPGDPVPLKDATSIYQPVLGTSKGSTYFTFAFFPGLKLAARINGSKLSVRAEGDELNAYLPTLKAQFKMDASPGYASSHYIVAEGKDLMIKTLAAIVGVIGFGKAEKVADLNKFVLDQ